MQHTEAQFDTLWEDCLPEPEPDGEARRCMLCEKNMLGQSGRVCAECLVTETPTVPDYYIPDEGEVVRKMPTCGSRLFSVDNAHPFCILPVGHKGEHACIPDGLTI